MNRLHWTVADLVQAGVLEKSGGSDDLRATETGKGLIALAAPFSDTAQMRELLAAADAPGVWADLPYSTYELDCDVRNDQDQGLAFFLSATFGRQSAAGGLICSQAVRSHLRRTASLRIRCIG